MNSSKMCFVISAIGAPGSKERKHGNLVLNYLIRPVATELGYEVQRGDESGHAGMVTVDTINMLFDAELVIADLTFLNPNVFYELGLRHSTRRPTIHMASDDTVVPFDNADHRAIFYDVLDWDSHERARQQLQQNIEAVERVGVTNPVTIAQAHKNDARLSKVIDGVTYFLGQLEQRIERLSEEPPAGHVTREQHKQITEGHRSEILQIVQAIRRRIDDRSPNTLGEPQPQVSDVLRRLTTIEKLVLNGNAAHIHTASAITQ